MRSLRRSVSMVAFVLLAGSWALGCEDPEPVDEDEPLLPADFYLTVKLSTHFIPQAVDLLEVVMYDSTMVFVEDEEGEHYDGGITWLIRDGDRGDEFVVTVTGEFFESNAMRVSENTFEFDTPFIVPSSWSSQSPDESAFSVTATTFWEDPDGELQETGRGTGELELPQEWRNPTTIEVDCHGDWAWTCRTACEDGVMSCLDGVEDCGDGDWDCVDGCCV